MKPTGPRAMVWVTPFRASWMLTVPGQGLHRALADEDDAGDEGDGEQDVEQAAGDVDPEVADGGRVAAGEAAHQGDGGGDADGRRHELLDRERADLGEVRHGRLAAVVLPVGVGEERDGGVEAERRRHRPEVLRVEGQRALDRAGSGR